MMNISTVNVDNFSMNYFKFGKGPRNFVILPGLSIQSVMSAADAVADAFSMALDDFTIYVFDRWRGIRLLPLSSLVFRTYIFSEHPRAE